MSELYANKLITEADNLKQLFDKSGDPAVLEELINSLKLGIKDPNFITIDVKKRAFILWMLGINLLSRYTYGNNQTDFHDAFDLFLTAIDQFEKNDPNAIIFGGMVGSYVRTQCQGNNRVDIISSTIKFYDVLIQKADATSDDYLSLLNDKANALRELHDLTFDPESIKECICIREYIHSRINENSTWYPTHLSNYGNALRQRYSKSGSVDDLKRAIGLQEQAISYPVDADSEQIFKYTLALSYLEEYELSNEQTDLQKASRALKRSIELTDKNSPNLFPRLIKYATSLRMLYEHDPTLSYLDDAISSLETVRKATPKDKENQLATLSEISKALTIRHDATGNINDIQHAIDAQEELVRLLSDDASPHLPYQLADYSILLTKGFVFTRDKTLLMRAEDGFKTAIELAKDDIQFAARCFHNLANVQGYIFDITGERSFLEKAIDNRLRAIERTPNGSNELAGRIAGMGQDELQLYELNKNESTLESAIKHLLEASQMDHPSRVDAAAVWCETAHALAMRYDLSSAEEDLKAAQDYLSKALDIAKLQSAPLLLRVATAWAYWAQKREAWAEASDAFKYALRAADELVQGQSSIIHQYHQITSMEDLHIFASYSLFKTGEFKESVMALERGRARLLNRKLSLRSQEIRALEDLDRDLAQAAFDVANRLDSFYSLESARLTTHPVSSLTYDLTNTLEEWKKIVSEIRQRDGFQHFAEGPSFEDVVSLAAVKPVVYIVPIYWAGLAFVVDPSGNIHHLYLPNLSTVNIHNLIQRMTLKAVRDGNPLTATDEICRWLWSNAMEPICELLDKLSITEIFLIPIGILGIFPLHAAWREDSSMPTGRIYTIDKLSISYIPSAKAELEMIPATRNPLQSVIIIEDPTSTLTFAPIESAQVLQHFKDVRLLGGEAATREKVLDQLAGRNVLHFSCHGYSDPIDPMHSSLIMAFDERLTVSDIHTSRVEAARIVVLSACETGLIGQQTMDEVLGFPVAWMGSGVPCIISSIWSVDDESTAHLMSMFYQNLMVGKMRPDKAMRLAQIQLRDTTLLNSNFAHPYFWGAFYVTGL